MAQFTQENRPIAVTTPLGEDVLLLVGFTGQEAISRLFSFQLDLLAENETQVNFDGLLGQPITITQVLPDEQERYFSGICNRVSQGGQDDTFTAYRLEIVPKFWLLTRRAQSRIFQQKSVPDILKAVLKELDVKYELQGNYQPRDFCVQYRETDFNFASRLMEEEGIYYFFTHTAKGHQMVVADTPQSHPDLPPSSALIYEEVEGGTRDEDRISGWEKVQELRSGKYTLWDHCFEIPHKPLDAEGLVQDSVQVGDVKHTLKVGGNDKLEIYDYPGEYAQRFDGTAPGGGDRASDVQKIFQDNRRTVDIRIEQETLPSLVIQGSSNCRHLVTGHKFTLERHFNADGPYLLTSVQHFARVSGDYRSSQGGESTYHNTFTCIPFALPFRPLRTTPKPFVQGTQTAVVVGPPGDEIFTDKYSRVKVKFHWDRDEKKDANSSCWLRVGTLWAGKQWGVIHIPRIGQEVIVAFQEGDPDQPIIIGSVYNAEQMPPYALPDNKTQSGIKSRSSMSGGAANFNEIRFEDKKGQEEVYAHAERNLTTMVENDESRDVGHDRTTTIGNDETKTVKHDQTLTVQNNRTATVMVNDKETVGSSQTITIASSQSITIGASRSTTIAASDSLTVAATISITAGGGVTITSGGPVTITAPTISLTTPMLQVAGVVQCTSLIASVGVISPVYTPGVGNLI